MLPQISGCPENVKGSSTNILNIKNVCTIFNTKPSTFK